MMHIMHEKIYVHIIHEAYIPEKIKIKMELR